jgi:nitroreductase
MAWSVLSLSQDVAAQAASAAAQGGPLAPKWFVLPLALIALVVVAGHWITLGRARMPAFRRSVRSANGVVMMLAIPVLAFGFGVVPVGSPRLFVLTWMLGWGLLFLVLVLAGLDMAYTWREARLAQRALRQEAALLRAGVGGRGGRGAGEAGARGEAASSGASAGASVGTSVGAAGRDAGS